MESSLGHHYIWDIYDCSYSSIATTEPVEALMTAIVKATNLTLISSKFNQFSPHGVTGIFLLEESHLSAHSWPENNYIAIDLFSCIPLNDIEQIYDLLRDHLGNVRIETKTMERGFISESDRKTHNHH